MASDQFAFEEAVCKWFGVDPGEVTQIAFTMRAGEPLRAELRMEATSLDRLIELQTVLGSFSVVWNTKSVIERTAEQSLAEMVRRSGVQEGEPWS